MFKISVSARSRVSEVSKRRVRDVFVCVVGGGSGGADGVVGWQVSRRDVWLSGFGMKFLLGTCQFRAVRMMVTSVRGFSELFLLKDSRRGLSF